MHVLAVIALVGWIFGFTSTVLNLLFLPRLRAGGPTRGPLVSVIIPARDEARTIESSVRAWLAQLYQDLEIIVVNDRSTDATGDILNRAAAEDPRLIVVTGEEPPPGWLGKPWALHQGSQRARGSLLLFADADVIYAPEAVAAAVARIEQERAALITLFPYMEMEGFWENVAMPALGVVLFQIMLTFLSNYTKAPWMAMGGGTGNLVRRADYDGAGGHEALKDAVVDDIGLGRLVRRYGGRTVALRADDFVRIRMYHGGGEIVRGFTKNLFSAFGRSYLIGTTWVLVTFINNVPPYLFALMGDRVSMVTVSLITVSRVLLYRSLRYPLAYALLANPVMALFWCWVCMRSMWITGVRRQLAWRGRSYDAARITTGM